MTKQPITEIDGIQIFVTEDGWWTCEKDGQTLKSRSLPSLTKKLAQLKSPVEAFLFSNYGIRAPTRVSVVPDKRRGRYRRAKTGVLISKYTAVRRYDPEAEEEFAEIEKEFIALQERFSKVKDRLERA
jgi:hypothetical protein